MKGCKSDLATLETKRETPEEQRSYLLEVAMQFQRITTLALDVKYGSDDMFDQDSKLKLSTAVQNRSEKLSDDIKLKGRTFEFSLELSSGNFKGFPDSANSAGYSEADVSKTNGTIRDLDNIRLVPNHSDLEEVMYDQNAIAEPSDECILAWLTEIYTTSRGFEMGTFDPSLLAIIMKKQSVNWTGLALGYISDMVSLIHSFIINLLHRICSDRRVQIGLQSMLMDGLIDMYKQAFKHVQFILDVERTGTPRTLNHYFNDNLEARYVRYAIYAH